MEHGENIKKTNNIKIPITIETQRESLLECVYYLFFFLLPTYKVKKMKYVFLL